MPYFLASEPILKNSEFELEGEEAFHLKLSHRVQVGEQVKIQDPNGVRYVCEVVKVGTKTLRLKSLQQLVVPEEPVPHVTLFQSLVSEKALDFILQKSTELGANAIVLFYPDHVAAKLSLERQALKAKRYQKILWESAKQSERVRPPVLFIAATMQELFFQLKVLDIVLVLDKSGVKFNPSHIETVKNIGVVVGPEGGWSLPELEKFKSLSNSQVISLGPILLRAETAALAALVLARNSAK